MSVREGTERALGVLTVAGFLGLAATAVAAAVATHSSPPVWIGAFAAYVWCLAPLVVYAHAVQGGFKTTSSTLSALWVTLWLIPTTFSLPTLDGYTFSFAVAAGGAVIIKTLAFVVGGFRK